MNQLSKSYELEERTGKFGESIISFCKEAKKDVITTPLISQLIRSSTSIGANYMEANGASSRRDFANKIYICRKEAQETKHWLRMMRTTLPEKSEQINKLSQERHELVLIFQKISSTLRESAISNRISLKN